MFWKRWVEPLKMSWLNSYELSQLIFSGSTHLFQNMSSLNSYELTGLIWVYSPHAPQKMSWQNSYELCGLMYLKGWVSRTHTSTVTPCSKKMSLTELIWVQWTHVFTKMSLTGLIWVWQNSYEFCQTHMSPVKLIFVKTWVHWTHMSSVKLIFLEHGVTVLVWVLLTHPFKYMSPQSSYEFCQLIFWGAWGE